MVKVLNNEPSNDQTKRLTIRPYQIDVKFTGRYIIIIYDIILFIFTLFNINTAERAVKLMEDFNESLTINEE